MFVPNDVTLNHEDHEILVITGPNMAGKSTYMRQVAVLVLMAQVGSFIPAKEGSICPVDRIFTRIGASDDILTGQSTFMMEMKEVSYILKHATSRSLLILDEIGRGTSTFDGMSIARAVLEYCAQKLKAKTLFATHYHELTALDQTLPNVRNYNIAVRARGEDDYSIRESREYQSGERVEETTADIEKEFDIGGARYVFDGWYKELPGSVTDEPDPKEKVSQDEWEEGYEPTDEELENGVVNFYAHYVLADIDPDTGVETDFFGLPLMLCAGAAVLGCKNRKKEEDE